MTAKKKATKKKPVVKKKALAAASLDPSFPFRHVVLLMLENRSFDQMLGLLQKEMPGLDGVLLGGALRWNVDRNGKPYQQRDGAVRKVDPDPPHRHLPVLDQLAGPMGGFVKSFQAKYPKAKEAILQQVMTCYTPNELPALSALARHFIVCDGWHCSVPGPTWTNRLFAMSGTSLGRVEMPALFDPNLHRYQQPSVFRRIVEAGKSYRVYFGDFPLALLLEDQRKSGVGKNFSRMKQFYADAKGPESKFPSFAFIEPTYLLSDANDDHPDHDVNLGQALIADVYDAIRANDKLWESTLLVVTYDEHGGFYDHVAPGATTPPDGSTGEHDFKFDRLGVRVPMVLVSPWYDHAVLHGAFDHTSLLRMLQESWGLGELGKRTANAADPFAALPRRTSPRTDSPETLPRFLGAKPKAKKVKKLTAAAAKAPLNDHQRAIVAFSDYLETLAPPAPKKQAQLAKKKFVSPAASGEVAHQRALNFLRKKGAKL